MAAGSCSIVEETYGTVKKIKWSWTAGTGSDDSSIATPTTTNAYNGKIQAGKNLIRRFYGCSAYNKNI